MIRHSPAPFHRRRLMLELAGGLSFDSVLDVGCGNGETLAAFRERHPRARLAGVDVSELVVAEDAAANPGITFRQLDIGASRLDESFDLVLCSEVIEHVDDWQGALRNLRAMCKRHLLLTVPAGPVFPIDRSVGHLRHFSPESLAPALRAAGFEPEIVWRWGFPFHTLYKSAINVFPDRSLQTFASGDYGAGQKVVAALVTASFYLNARDSRFGRQLVVRASAA